MKTNLTPVIGLEIHIEQNTKSKMFCGCSADFFSKKPNSLVCPVCLGLPGALPYPNFEAITNTIKLGHAFGGNIIEETKFDRKHYFYPDLPKGYQISQYDMPIVMGAHHGNINIKRIHLEEDTAKLTHSELNGEEVSLIDFNRSGVPLIEMVTEPDFHDVESVDKFLKEVALIVKYLGISTGSMEKGSMRLEANISMTEDPTVLPDYKVELKNINSFKFLKKALLAEIERQTEELSVGRKLVQETRGYNEATGKTFSQRIKEEAHDYRYFPEPDIPPISISRDLVQSLKDSLPELPMAKAQRYIKEFDLSELTAEVLVSESLRAAYFEEAVKLIPENRFSPKYLAAIMVNQKLDLEFPEAPGLIKRILETQMSEYAGTEELNVSVEKVLKENFDAVNKYKSGKLGILGFLVGQVQKELKGKGDPKKISELLAKELSKQ